jgi:hypothetical protein
MDSKEIMLGLFADLGPVLSPEAIVAEESGTGWSVLFPEDVTIDVVLHDNSDSLTFTAGAGDLPDDAGVELLAGLLHLGFRWRESGTVYAALDDQKRVSVIYRHPVAGMTVDRLSQILSGLIKRRTAIAEALQATNANLRREHDAGVGPDQPNAGVAV